MYFAAILIKKKTMRKLITTTLALLSFVCAMAQFSYQDGNGYNLSYEESPYNDAYVTCLGLDDAEVAGTKDLIIPNNVKDTTTGKEYTVTAIAESAFTGNVDFTGSLTISDSVETIGDFAFDGCSGFSGTLTLGKNITTIGEAAFKDCGFTGDLVIPYKVKDIGTQAFSSCSFDGSLTIEANELSSIGELAFSYCSSLTEVICYATTPPELGTDVFYGSEIDAIMLYVPKNTANFYAVKWTGFFSVETISDTKVEQATIATAEGYNLKYILNSETKTAKCAYLENIMGPVTSKEITVPETVTLKEVTYTVTSIGANAFTTDTDSMVSVILPNSIEELGERCFATQEITGVTLPKDLQVIPVGCFEGSSIETIELPNRLVIIDSRAFANTNLQGITLPEGLNYIGNYAFENFSGDSIVVLSESPMDLANTPNVFGEEYNYLDVKLVVPFGSEIGYKEAEVWKNFTNISSSQGMSVGYDYVDFYKEDTQPRSVEVNANVDWEPKTDDDWFTVEKAQTHSGVTITLVDTTNTTYKEGKIVLTAIDAPSVNPVEITVKMQGSINIVKQIDSITIDIDSLFKPLDLKDYFTYGDNSKLQFMANTWADENSEGRELPQSTTVTINGSKMGIITNTVGITNVGVEAIGGLNSNEIDNLYNPDDNPDQPDQSDDREISQEYMEFKITVTDEDSEGNPKPECKPFTVDSTITHIEGCYGDDDENGSIKLEVSGGTAPYKFRWSNTQTGSGIYNLSYGVYSVMISDSLGCVESREYYVDIPEYLYSYINGEGYPGCGQSNGSIEMYVGGGTEPYTYHWSNDSTGKSISNVPAGVYTFNVTDANGCEYSETVNLNSDSYPWIDVVSKEDYSKCNEKEGEIHVSVYGGTPPYKLEWEDGERGFSRTNLAVGQYNLLVTDYNYCTATYSHNVRSNSVLKPAIGLVSVDKETGNNLVIWQKEDTKEVDSYNIYRENLETRKFDSIDSWEYNNISVYEDTDVDASERSWRYKLQAVNECGDKSRMSKSFKTMHLDTLTKTPEGIMLSWDDYEGELYPTYAIHRILGNDTTIIRVSSRISYYFDANPPKGVKYFVAVEMPEAFNVNNYLLKAESGPFSLAISNIAESEQSVNIENEPAVFNQISVYPTIVKDVVTVNVGNKQAQVSVFSIIGEKLYSAEVSQTAEIDMSAMPHGIYTVVVTVEGVGYGYKVIVND